MTVIHHEGRPFGYRWRSSKRFIMCTITIALFSETLLYGFIVPILSYMLEDRLHLDATRTQSDTTRLLAIYGFMSLISAPIVGHIADKTPNKRTPLLVALAGCLVGTVLVACTPSLWAVYLGRILQAIASSASWIVGLATLTDAFGLEHLGKVSGVVLSFATAGTITGPTVAGTLLELVGYWPTWCVPMAVLVLDIVARLLMIETRERSSSSPDNPTSPVSSASATETPVQNDESTGLLSPVSESYQTVTRDPCAKGAREEKKPIISNFYRIMLSDIRALTGLGSCLIFSSLMASFDNTVPLHVRDAFGWGSMRAGMMFFCLQIPMMIFNPLSGWLRDKIGVWYPMTLGWCLMAPLVWLLGTPGDDGFPWANEHTRGPSITIFCLIGIGTIGSLLQGAGPLELALVMKERQSKDPGIFGYHGARNRLFALVEAAFTLGIMVGPLLSGPLSETAGYYYMNLTFALICLAASVASLCCLDRKHSKHTVFIAGET